VANLVRGGRLERAWPRFLSVRLWRAPTACAAEGKAHERTGFLGRPAGGKKETLRRRKPKRVVDFRLKNSRGSHRRSQGKDPEAGEAEKALFRERSS
jgi:hypothetical protein